MRFKCLADAEKMAYRQGASGIYSLIGNLHKENANYELAFDAAAKGLKAAKALKDTNDIISLLGLKAMLIHTHAMFLHNPMNDTSINLQLAALKIAESNVKYERLRIVYYDI